MKSPRKRRVKLSRRTIASSIVGFILISFLTWFLISFFTMRVELEVINLYEFPEIAALSNSFEGDTGVFSVAIDGNVVAGSENETIRPTASTAKMILGLSIMNAKPFGLGEPGETITITEKFYDRYIYYLYNEYKKYTMCMKKRVAHIFKKC